MKLRLLLPLLLFAAPASAHELVGYEPCHLLCSTEAGRIESRLVDPHHEDRWLLRVETVGIRPFGHYEIDRYTRIEQDGSAFAVQILPSLGYRIRDGMYAYVSFPWEYNQTSGVTLPTLHAADSDHVEFAPGRLSGAVHARIPVPEDWESQPWIGFGVGVSNTIGTVDVSDDVETHPDTAIEALGIGSDDVYMTMQLVRRPIGSWRASVGGEARLHLLPDDHVFGTTLGYYATIQKLVSDRWDVGVRLAGFRTLLPGLNVTQSSALIVTPTVGLALPNKTHVSMGMSSELPSRTLNENVLQTGGLHLAIEKHF